MATQEWSSTYYSGSALLKSTTGGPAKSMKLLLEQGAKPDQLNLDGEVAPMLIEAGANSNMLYLENKGKRKNLLMDSIIVEN